MIAWRMTVLYNIKLVLIKRIEKFLGKTLDIPSSFVSVYHISVDVSGGFKINKKKFLS